MRNLTKRTGALLAVLTLAVALVTVVGTTFAYFTTYASAKGTVEVVLHDRTEISEDFGNWTKHVTIANNPGADEKSQSVFVRAKAFSGTTYPIVYSGDATWSPGSDGYYYYATPLAPGEKTTQLDVRITDVPSGANVTNGDQFNVVVIYETTPVLYDTDGNPYANWDFILDNGNLEGGDQ